MADRTCLHWTSLIAAAVSLAACSGSTPTSSNLGSDGGGVGGGGGFGTGGANTGGTGGAFGTGGSAGAAVSGGSAGATDGGPATGTNGPLRVDPDNPRYFEDASGHVVYLTGSHTWNDLQDMTTGGYLPNLISSQGFGAYLDWLVSENHNFIRMWQLDQAWESSSHYRVSPEPWVRTGPGTALDGLPRFDLTKPDPAYYDRLRQRVLAARDKGIYVSVMLFGGYWSTEHPETWAGNPFNAGNNINGINGDPNGDGLGNEIYTMDLPDVDAIQKAHAKKVMDTLDDLDNVLYEIANEVRAPSTPWQYDMINYVKSYQSTLPVQHPVGMTGYDTIPDSDLYNSAADWISPSNSGGDYKSDPPAANGNKVIIIDTDHLWGTGGNVQWVWKSFTRGLNPIFMEHVDLNSNDVPDSDNIRKAMGDARAYADKMNLATATPSTTLCSTTYCLVDEGVEYLTYAPGGGSFTVDLSGGSGKTFSAEWFNVAAHTAAAGSDVSGGSNAQSFDPPFSGDAILYLKQR